MKVSKIVIQLSYKQIYLSRRNPIQNRPTLIYTRMHSNDMPSALEGPEIP